ncbi:MAG TPA: maleylpyruvate isomerase, partial [Streptosporangiaceae bacterium]
VHYLDLAAGLADPPPSDPIPLTLVRRVLDGLLGQGLPLDADDETYALKGTGRVALTEDDRAALGPAASRFPLFG